MSSTKYQYFKDENNNIYKKETDYAKRSWWYIAEFQHDHGFSINWKICDGKPTCNLTNCNDSIVFNHSS